MLGGVGWEFQRDTKHLPKGRCCWSGSLLNWHACLQTKSCEVLLEMSRYLGGFQKQKELENWWGNASGE